MKRFTIFLAAASLLAAAVSCGKGGTPVERITVDRPEIWSFPGKTVQLGVSCSPEEADVSGLEWSSSDETVATVDGNGLVSILDYGETTIYVRAGAVFAECRLHSMEVREGMFYNSDGSFGEDYDADKAVAVVFHIGQHENDRSDYSGSGIGSGRCHGYAVALSDAIDMYCTWGPYTELGCYPVDEHGDPVDNFAGNTSDTDWSGYLYTAIIRNAGAAEEGMWVDDRFEGYPAGYYAVSYEQKVAAPEFSSGWFLPAGSQLWELYQKSDALFADCPEAALVEDSGYWSSSEYFYIPSEGVNFLNLQYGRIEGLDKSGGNLVRTVIAF